MKKITEKEKKAFKKVPPKTKAISFIIMLIPVLLVGYCTYDIFSIEPQEDPMSNKNVFNSSLDGSVFQVEFFLKDVYLKDPDSYEGIEWGQVGKPDLDEYTYMVWHKYRAKNSFGGYVVSKQMFFLDSLGNVVDVKDVSF